jgi:hypothetical protein
MCLLQVGKLQLTTTKTAMKRILMSVLFLLAAWQLQSQNFTVSPNPACVGQTITFSNVTSGYNSYDWSFCAANPEEQPNADILDVPSVNFNKPVFVALANDPVTNKFHAFVTNYDPLLIPPFTSHITRLDFDPNILDPSPTPFTVSASPAAPFPALEGIQIVHENGTWYGFVVGGVAPPYIAQLNFGNSLLNANPSRTYMTNQGQLSYPHDLYIFKDEATNQWFGLTANSGPTQDQGVQDGSITRFRFNNGLNAIPQGQNLGGFSVLEDPVGIYAIKQGDNWFVFVTDRWKGLIRLDFGNSLTNTPTAHVIGTLGGTLHRPRDISLLRYCEDIYGFVVNENTQGGNHSLIRLHFQNGITQPPTATAIAELDGFFNFPHSISDVLRSGDEMFALITNVLNNNITRIFFPTCEDDIPAQNIQTPNPISYNIPGMQTIELIVDLGLPTQTNVCQEIMIYALPTSNMSGGTSICEGDEASIQVSFTGVAPFTFSYTDGTNTYPVTTSSNPYTLVVSPVVNTTYSVTAVSDGNCTGNSFGNPVSIQVSPIANATFQYPTQTLCTSSPPMSPVKADPTTSGVFSASPAGLSINPSTGVIAPGTSQINIPYTVTYTTTGDCPDSFQVFPIIVTDQPEANFTYPAAAFCVNAAVVNPSPATPSASFGEFSATPPGLSLNSVNGAINPSLSQPGNYVVTNFIEAADGCPAATFNVNVEIAALPEVDFVADTVCFGNPTTLTGTSSVPAGTIAANQWFYNGNLIGLGSELNYTFPTDGVHTVRLVAISDKTCSSQIEKQVLVLRPEALMPTAILSDDLFICTDHTGAIRLEIQGGSGDEAEWFEGDCSGEPFATTTQPFLFINPPPIETTSYFARWKTNCNISECVPVTVTVSPLPVVEFEADTVCFGAPTTFISTSFIDGGEITDYDWFFEPGIQINTTDSIITHIFSISGNHNVTLIAKSDMACPNILTKNIFVLPAPEVDLLQRIPPELQNLTGDTLHWCVYNTVTLDATDPANPHQIFQWSVGADSDTLQVGALGIGYELQYHQVTVTDTITGCVNTGSLYIIFSIGPCEIGIFEPGIQANIKIYPNPANDHLNIEIDNAGGIDVIQFVSIYGHVVETMEVSAYRHEFRKNISLEGLHPGVYFVRMTGQRFSNTYKVIVNPSGY